MVQTVLDDLVDRPLHAQPSDTQYRAEVSALVSSIRHHAGLFDPETGSIITARDDDLYTMDEVVTVLKGINSNKLAWLVRCANRPSVMLKHSAGTRLLQLGTLCASATQALTERLWAWPEPEHGKG